MDSRPKKRTGDVKAIPALMRAALREAVPEVGDWKRDRGDGLFRGFLRSQPDAALARRLASAGFSGRTDGRFLTVLPLPVWADRIADAFPVPPDSFSASVRRDGETDLSLLAAGLKLLEAGEEAEIAAYRDRVHAAQAVALRVGRGSVYAAALVLWTLLEDDR